MSSLFRDLDELPPERRYAPVREPHVQAAVDITRKMIYGDRQAVEADLPKPPRLNPVDHIAELMRALTYGEMIEFAAELCMIKGDGEITQQNLPDILWNWANSSP